VSPLGSVRVTVTVAVTPADAFDVFTTEIDRWYRRGLGLLTSNDPATTLRFEHGVGGRLLEVGASPAADGDRRVDEAPVVRGTVTVWEPAARLVFLDRRGTEVDVRFEAVAAGTKVVVEHRGLDRLRPDQAASAAKYGWRRLAEWFERHMEERAT
jgi:hypothetical protein